MVAENGIANVLEIAVVLLVDALHDLYDGFEESRGANVAREHVRVAVEKVVRVEAVN